MPVLSEKLFFPSRPSSQRSEKKSGVILDVEEATSAPRLTSRDLFGPKSRNGLFCANDPLDHTDPMGLETGFWEGLIPVWGEGHMAADSFHEGRYGMAAFHAGMAASDLTLAKAGVSALAKPGIKGAAKVGIGKAMTKAVEHEAGTGYRYVGKAEAKAIGETGKIPTVNKAGDAKNVFFTNERYTSGAEAQKSLPLPSKPEFRVEFDLKQAPAGYGGLAEGGGAEFTLREGAKPIPATEIIPPEEWSITCNFHQS